MTCAALTTLPVQNPISDLVQERGRIHRPFPHPTGLGHWCRCESRLLENHCGDRSGLDPVGDQTTLLIGSLHTRQIPANTFPDVRLARHRST